VHILQLKQHQGDCLLSTGLPFQILSLDMLKDADMSHHA